MDSDKTACTAMYALALFMAIFDKPAIAIVIAIYAAGLRISFAIKASA